MKKNSVKNEVFSDAIFTNPSTSPSLGGVKNGADCGGQKAKGMPFDLVTTVTVKGTKGSF